jgi:hypothetical protein
MVAQDIDQQPEQDLRTSLFALAFSSCSASTAAAISCEFRIGELPTGNGGNVVTGAVERPRNLSLRKLCCRHCHHQTFDSHFLLSLVSRISDLDTVLVSGMVEFRCAVRQVLLSRCLSRHCEVLAPVSAVTDQELVLAALREVGSIIAEHLEATTSDADEVIAQLVAALDTQELANAINRLERGYGLRVVK